MPEKLTEAEMKELFVHEFCDFFDLPSEEDLEAMGAGIRESRASGKRLGITVWRRPVGPPAIIDGRCRFYACRNAGIELGPDDFDVIEADEVGARLISLEQNVNRRHLSASQKAMTMARIAALAGGKLGRAGRQAAADKAGVSAGSIAEAVQVLSRSDDEADMVLRGRKTIQQAKRDLGLKARPLAPPKGQSRVNGVLCDDPPDIAERRARGEIPAGVVIDVSVPAAATDAGAVAEEYAEREAIRDDVSDEDWLDNLPLSSVLKDQQLATFREDALLYRTLEAARKAFAHHATRAVNKARRKGMYKAKLKSFLKVDSPDRWIRCCEVKDGGCAGAGFRSFGGEQRECTKCYGRGYWANS